MDSLPKSRLLRFVERAVVLARRAVARYATPYLLKRFTLRQHVVLLYLKVKKTTTYRDLVDELIEMPRIRDALDPCTLDALQGVRPPGDGRLAGVTERLDRGLATERCHRYRCVRV